MLLQGRNKVSTLFLPAAWQDRAATTAESTPPDKPKTIPLALEALICFFIQDTICFFILMDYIPGQSQGQGDIASL